MKHFWTVLVIFMLVGCARSRLVNVDNEPMLLGNIEKSELYLEFPDFKKNEAGYIPRIQKLDSLRLLNHRIDVILFLGTWCHDSVQEAPKFLKLYDALNSSFLTLEIYALNRQKQGPSGLANDYNIDFVPTFLFLRDGIEIGRIVEYPEESMEADFLRILQNNDLI